MNAYSKSFSPIHNGITIPPLSLLVTLVLLLLPQMLWAGESLAFFQVDFNLGGTVYADTDWGCVHFTFIGQEPIMYFNLAINDTWQVQNIPVLSIEGPGVEQTIIYYFALTTPSGVEVNNLNYGYAFTTDVQTSRPTTFTPALVEDKLIALWPGFGDNVAPPVESAQPLIGGEVAIAETMLSSLVSSSPTKHCHKNFPNQQCGKNECCPTAISNSLKFLNNRHKNLNMPDSMTSIDAMKNATNWRNGCSLFLWQFDKKEYMKKNKYPITTRTISDISKLIEEMDDGQDIEITVLWGTYPDYKGHTSCLVGITKLKDGGYTLDLAEDTDQTDPNRGCEGPTTYKIDPNSSKIRLGGFVTYFVSAVVQCPKVVVTVTDSNSIPDPNQKTKVTESSGGSTTGAYRIALTREPNSFVIITAEPNGNEAGQPNDIDLGAGPGNPANLFFNQANWKIPQQIAITTINDDRMEATHGVIINHAAISPDSRFNGVEIDDWIVEIADDDSPAIEEPDGNTVVCESGVADNYTIVLNIPPIAPVFITADPGSEDIDVGNGPDAAATIVFDSGNWFIPQPINVFAVDDNLLEDTEFTSIHHTCMSLDPLYEDVPVDKVVVTVLDNECGVWGYLDGDINKDCKVNMWDFASIAVDWLDCTEPYQPGCIDEDN